MSFPTFPHFPPPFPHLSISPKNLPHPHLLMGCGGVGVTGDSRPTFPNLGTLVESRKGGSA